MLHVEQPSIPWAVDYVPEESVLIQAEKEEILKAKEKMQKEITKLAESQGVEVISDVREGDTVAEILKEQDENGVDLIVMPSHGKTGWLKRLMGHVSEKVMEEAKSPVLLVGH